MSVMKELQSEITRLARKEIKKELEPIKRVNAAQRGYIADLRREVTELQKEVGKLQRAATNAPVEIDDTKGFGGGKGNLGGRPVAVGLVGGFMLGRPGHSALIPEHYIQSLVGGNSLWANLFASVSGAFMYFATLTEVPILQGLIGAGMGKGPALSLLLAGPALSLPNMLVIGGVIGVKKTATFCAIIVILSTIAGMTYGWLVG